MTRTRDDLARIIGDVLSAWYTARVIPEIDRESYDRAKALVDRCLEHEEIPQP